MEVEKDKRINFDSNKASVLKKLHVVKYLSLETSEGLTNDKKAVLQDIYKDIVNVKSIFLRAELQDKCQDYVPFFLSKVMIHFFKEDIKTVLSKKDLTSLLEVPYLKTETYLLSYIKLLHEIDSLSIELAMKFDLNAVKKCLSVVETSFEMFLEFSFRNGKLRLSFDSIKYVKRNIQNRVYELDLVTEKVDKSNGVNKKQKLDILEKNKKEFAKFVEELTTEDNYREKVIKQCRDVQKASKRAIYAIQKNDLKKATGLITDCLKFLSNIEELTSNPEFLYMQWSYKGCLEELCEAFLFYSWTLRAVADIELSAPFAEILKSNNSNILSEAVLQDLVSTKLSSSIYIGALSDFTGELGRVGVVAAGNRETAKVSEVLETIVKVKAIVMNLFKKELPDSNQEKKLSQLDRNLTKMRTVLYDQLIATQKANMLSRKA